MKSILKFHGQGLPNLDELFQILKTHSVTILDRDLLPTILLVDLDDTQLKSLQPILHETWSIFQEKIYKKPSTRLSTNLWILVARARRQKVQSSTRLYIIFLA